MQKITKATIESIGRKIRIWQIMDEPHFFPSFSNLSIKVQDTISVLSPLNPVYFGSTILKLYGLTTLEPQDLDIFIKDKTSFQRYRDSNLLKWVDEHDAGYRNNRPTHTFECVKTGMSVHLVLDEPNEKIYVRNMCITSLQEVIEQVYKAALEKPYYENKHCMRLFELAQILEGNSTSQYIQNYIYYHSAIELS